MISITIMMVVATVQASIVKMVPKVILSSDWSILVILTSDWSSRRPTTRWSTTGCSSQWTSWSTLWPSTLSYRCKILIDSTYLSLNKDQFPLCDLQKRVKDEAAEGGFQESGDILKQRHGGMKKMIFINEGSLNKGIEGRRNHLEC